MNDEIWKPIAGYEGLYEISSYGRIFSLPKTRKGRGGFPVTKPARMMKPKKASNGYQMITLWKEGKRTNKTTHRLVAEAFLPNPCNHPQVNHLDSDRFNPRLDNLEWCDRSSNHEHAMRAGSFSPVKNPNFARNLCPEKVMEIHALRALGGWSHAKLAKRFDVCQESIRAVLIQKTWKELHPSHKDAA